jgi:hypothetical protein
MMRTWNALSRSFCWLAGSFIFCDANAFRNMGGQPSDQGRMVSRALTRRGHNANLAPCQLLARFV